MKICAIIAEYNPFHLGHLKHLKLAKEKSGCNYTMAILSGNFSQRGEPCIANYTTRAKMAKECGADLVVAMPTAYACASAEVFALAGVKIATMINGVTHLAFGCETNNFEALKEIAKIIIEEPNAYKTTLQQQLKLGNSFVKSRELALIEHFKYNDNYNENSITEIINIIKQPNNILAIEYLKALIKTNSKLTPVFIVREKNNYHSKSTDYEHTSATAIRQLVYNNQLSAVSNFMPKASFELLNNFITNYGLVNKDTFSRLIMYKLKTATKDEIKNCFDVNEGLENRIIKFAKQTNTLDNFLECVQTKRYTQTRINRILLSLLLGINESIVKNIYTKPLPFIKLLEFDKDNKKLLNKIFKSKQLIFKDSDYKLFKTKYYYTLQTVEKNAEQVYNLLFEQIKQPN